MGSLFVRAIGIMFGLLCITDAAKLRSWVGPDYFFEGNFPSNRTQQGLASADDGKVYVFGGLGMTGAGEAPQTSDANRQSVTIRIA
jgi:hypothetical protein